MICAVLLLFSGAADNSLRMGHGLSDRYGRKQLIVMSNLFSTVSMLMFGLSGTYPVAAISRVIGGWYVRGLLRAPQAFLTL